VSRTLVVVPLYVLREQSWRVAVLGVLCWSAAYVSLGFMASVRVQAQESAGSGRESSPQPPAAATPTQPNAAASDEDGDKGEAGPAFSSHTQRESSAAVGGNTRARKRRVREFSSSARIGRHQNLVGTAESASQGTVGQEELSRRPILRPGEVLETVPGVIITQHAGAGKANQYFLRGHNLDHGSDFATTVDGVPVNLGTHAHGQGYTDINWLIPELIEGVDYRKGPYWADVGDFSSAGAANIRYVDQLDKRLIKLEGGTYHYGRVLYADSHKIGPGRLFYGLSGSHDDGAWKVPARYWRGLGVLKYSQGDRLQGFSISAFGYYGDWTSTDQIPERAISGDNALGLKIGRFGSLDPSIGGTTARGSLSAEWHKRSSAGVTTAMLYAFGYGLDLYSNFTGFLDQEHSDSVWQRDRRTVLGGKATHTWFGSLGEHQVETRVGFDVRTDFVDVTLSKVQERRVWETVRSDDVLIAGLSLWGQNTFHWTPWLRSVIGLRADAYAFDVDNRAHNGSVDAISRATQDAILSPKGTLIFGPWAGAELYVSAGFGFHTVDARATAVADPDNRAEMFTRQRGGEVGLRFAPVRDTQSTLAFWVLDSDDETVFVGDSGANEPSGRRGRRAGVEWTNFWNVTDWLALDFDLALSRARFLNHRPEGDYIPDSVATVVAAGASIHDLHGFMASARLRYFGPRPLIEDNSVRSNGSALINAKLGYSFDDTWTLALDVLNLFDAHVNDQEYWYSTRLRGEPENPANSIASGGDGGYVGRVVHPAEPRSVRLSVTARL